MGCCSPEYRKVVNEKEQEVNEKGRESLPLVIKVISIITVIGALVAFIIMK